VISAAAELDWEAAGLIGSPITGPAGNHEYLLWLVERGGPQPRDRFQGPETIKAVVTATTTRRAPSSEAGGA